MAERGRLSESQIAVKGHLTRAGHGYHCSSDYRDVIETLKGRGVLRSGIHVQCLREIHKTNWDAAVAVTQAVLSNP
jgi:hypothetical protein